MAAPIRVVVLIACAGVLLAQGNKNDAVRMLTVCELLADRQALHDKNVAVVGRLDCGHSLIDNPCRLTADRCDRTIITPDGHRWPNQVYLGDWEEGAPRPAHTDFHIDQAVLDQKLSLLRSTTKLGFHKEPRYKTEGRVIVFSHREDVRDKWAVAFGRVYSPRGLAWDKCGDHPACGGYYEAPVALIILSRDNIIEVNDKVSSSPATVQK